MRDIQGHVTTRPPNKFAERTKEDVRIKKLRAGVESSLVITRKKFIFVLSALQWDKSWGFELYKRKRVKWTCFSEDGGSKVIRNISILSHLYMTSQHRRLHRDDV
jgi:hypothetical protein